MAFPRSNQSSFNAIGRNPYADIGAGGPQVKIRRTAPGYWPFLDEPAAVPASCLAGPGFVLGSLRPNQVL